MHVGLPPDMEQIGELPGIVVTNPYNEPDDYLIGFCDELWNVKGVVATDSLEEAKRKAETYYSGISSKWQASPYSDNEIRSFLKDEYEVDPDTAWWEVRCSFCGKESSGVSGIFSSDQAKICYGCVTEFYEKYLGDDR